MDAKSLERIGLLESEGSVYLALLRMGQSSAGRVARETKLNRVSVYRALQGLIDKGLVSYVIKANRREYQASDPREIERIIEKRKTELETLKKATPTLHRLFGANKTRAETSIYEGVKGAKAIWENMLEECREGDEWMVLGESKSSEIFGGFFKDLTKRMGKRGARLKIIYNQDAQRLINVRKRQSPAEIRVMPKEYMTPASLEVLRDNSLLVIHEPKLIIFHIKSPEVAKSFKSYFKLLWRAAKPVK